jgi:glycine cleavage system aminomethyltransferase T
VGIAFEGTSFLPKAGDGIAFDGRQVGTVTSSDIGHSLGRTLAMGYVEPAAAADGTRVTVTLAELGTSGEGVVHNRAFYDPDRERVRV